MELYARINILDGRAVRLPKGDVRDAIALDADPVARAMSWIDKGAHRLYVADLDAAAYRDYKNRPLIADLVAAVDVPVHVTGGVRSAPEVKRVLEDIGADRVGMGTAAIEDQVLLWQLCREYPGKIAVSLDVRPDEELAIRGWMVNSGRYLEEVLIELSSAGVAAFFVMQAQRDALVEPSNLGILRRALEIVKEPVIASGGARDLADLRSLRSIEVDGKRLFGVVVGREITEGRFTMDQARQVFDAA